MTFLEQCHQAHVERMVRLSQRASEAGPMRARPKPKIVRFDKKGRRLVPWMPVAPRPLPKYPPLPTPLQEAPIVRPLKVLDVVRVVAAAHDMNVKTLLDRTTRRKHICGPRQIAMYLAYVLGIASLPQIGRYMGGFDHSTCLNGRDIIAQRMLTDSDLAAKVEAIKRNLLASQENTI